MNAYRRRTHEQRYQIHALPKAGHTRTRIGSLLGRHKSTIEQRPMIVEQRGRLGDWEADTVIGAHQGHKPVLVTLTERKSRLSVIVKATNTTAQAVSQAITAALTSLKDWVHTLTYDNGQALAWHKPIGEPWAAQGGFAHP